MAEHIVVLTTTDTAEGASTLARAAVEARAAACAQIDGPIRSVYWWDGAVQEEQEWRVSYKLPAAKYAELEALIKRVHTYRHPGDHLHRHPARQRRVPGLAHHRNHPRRAAVGLRRLPGFV